MMNKLRAFKDCLMRLGGGVCLSLPPPPRLLFSRSLLTFSVPNRMAESPFPSWRMCGCLSFPSIHCPLSPFLPLSGCLLICLCLLPHGPPSPSSPRLRRVSLLLHQLGHQIHAVICISQLYSASPKFVTQQDQPFQ